MPKPSSAIDKAFAILEAVAGEGHPVSLAFLAEATAMPKQTVHRVLRQLEANQTIQRGVRPETYILGRRMRDFGLGVLKSATRTLPIRAEMERLSADVGESVNLGILNGPSVLYLERVEYAWPLRFTISPNDQLPAHAVAMGKLLLAHLPKRVRDGLLRGVALERFTEWTVTDHEALETQFEAILANGYSQNNQEYHIGLVGVGVPVRDRQGDVVAALAVHGVLPRITLEALLAHCPRMRETAKRISDLL